MKGRIFLFWVGVAFTLLVPVTIGLRTHDQTTAWIALLCGAFVTMLARVDDLTEIALGPVRAKMRETLREATATIAQLRSLAAALGRVASTDLMAGGFAGTMDAKMRLELYDQLIEQLKGLGLSTLQIKQATELASKAITLMYFRILRHAIEQRKKSYSIEGVSPALREIGEKFETLLDFPNWTAPAPDAVQAFAKENGVATPEVEQWISEYRHYVLTGEILRRELFLQRLG
jgi:hypothetical protein